MQLSNQALSLDFALEKNTIGKLGTKERAKEIALMLTSKDAEERTLGQDLANAGLGKKLQIALFMELARIDGGIIPAREVYRQINLNTQVRILEKVSRYGFGFFALGLIESELKEPSWRGLCYRLKARPYNDYLERLLVDALRMLPKTEAFREAYLNIPQHQDQLKALRQNKENVLRKVAI